MTLRTFSIDGVEIPRLLYGTAWKEDETERLAGLALAEGFRGVDTANQRRHYDEAAVGRAVGAFLRSGRIARDEVFLQTKFTFARSQDHRVPYDPAAPVPRQVEQSFASSLDHLGVDAIESYLLHGPTGRVGLTAADWEAWRAIEAIHDSGRARLVGVSNFSLEQLRSLCDGARVPPRFVQNRCFARQGWDRRLREFCAARGVVYQGFSLLTANREVLAHPWIESCAARYECTAAQIVLRFALDAGMIALTGTTSARHMREDLGTFDLRLDPEDAARIESILG